MRRFTRLLAAGAVWLGLAAPAQAGDGPPALSPFRYDEDYAYLRDPANRSGAWWERTKQIELSCAVDAYLDLGTELRVKYEAYRNDGFGAPPQADHDYFWVRALPYANVRAGRWRGFVQFIAAFEFEDEAGPSPIDEDRFDVLQAFGEAMWQAGEATWTVRVGRQMMAFGSERLVGTRYGPNVLQAYDVARVGWCSGARRVDAWIGRPVAVERDVFDDSPNSARATWGVYTTTERIGGTRSSLDAYYIGFENERARFLDATGRELRHTFGLRWFGAAGPWSWNLEAFAQAGRFAGRDIEAWSFASEIVHTWRDASRRTARRAARQHHQRRLRSRRRHARHVQSTVSKGQVLR